MKTKTMTGAVLAALMTLGLAACSSDDADEAQQSASEAMSTMGEKAEEAGSAVSEAASSAVDSAGEAWDDAADATGDAMDDAKQWGEDVMHDSEQSGEDVMHDSKPWRFSPDRLADPVPWAREALLMALCPADGFCARPVCAPVFAGPRYGRFHRRFPSPPDSRQCPRG